MKFPKLPQFPIEFVKNNGGFDIYARSVNFAGNAALVAGGLIGVTVITATALKAIGLTLMAEAIVTTVSLTFSLIGITGTVLAVCALTLMAMMYSREQDFQNLISVANHVGYGLSSSAISE